MHWAGLTTLMLPLSSLSVMQMAVVGLTGSCRPISRAPGILPMCQMLALTDPNQFVAGAGPLPRAIGLDIYVFGPANPPNRATFDTMETNLVNLVNALQPPFAAHPGHTAAPLALNAVPMQVRLQRGPELHNNAKCAAHTCSTRKCALTQRTPAACDPGVPCKDSKSAAAMPAQCSAHESG